jgi:hypothetical protein
LNAERLQEIKSWLKYWPEHNVVEVLPEGLMEIKENAPAIIWTLIAEVERLNKEYEDLYKKYNWVRDRAFPNNDYNY